MKELLENLLIEDPNLNFEINEENGEYLLSGMGPFQLTSNISHLEIIPKTNYLMGGSDIGDILVWDFAAFKLKASVEQIALHHFMITEKKNRVDVVDEFDTISEYKYGENEELMKKENLERIVLQYKQLLQVNYQDRNRQMVNVVSIRNPYGITVENLAEGIHYQLPKYGDRTIYERMTYIGEYRKIPVYEVFM